MLSGCESKSTSSSGEILAVRRWWKVVEDVRVRSRGNTLEDCECYDGVGRRRFTAFERPKAVVGRGIELCSGEAATWSTMLRRDWGNVRCAVLCGKKKECKGVANASGSCRVGGTRDFMERQRNCVSEKSPSAPPCGVEKVRARRALGLNVTDPPRLPFFSLPANPLTRQRPAPKIPQPRSWSRSKPIFIRACQHRLKRR